MKIKNLAAILAVVAGFAATQAEAATIVVGDPGNPTTPFLISTSTTWTANNVYDLAAQVYVTNGATLTIEPGTVIRSTTTANGAGSLAIERGSKIIANGTADAPITFTSSNDNGTYRLAANEWGNVTIMGRGVISNSFRAPVLGGDANTTAKLTPDGTQVANMEGLTAVSGQEDRILYGGSDDNDDSGSMSYVSLRYGGRVVGLGNELNGLSLGGVGRGTDINNIEIMNNVDDGIEVWGGTVNVKNFVVWNIGDDSFDVDQGWRGKGQFGLIVQGASANANNGSGFGDNALEIDGAERGDAQPVTATTLYNFTIIGQNPTDPGTLTSSVDHAFAWRDSSRVQMRNFVMMDLGGRLISNDTSDNEGSQGGVGIPTFASMWTTPFDTLPTNNAGTGSFAPVALYTAQSAGNNSIGQGFAVELTDSVFFRNLNNAAYTTSDSVSVTTAGGSNAGKGNVVAAFDGGNPNANMPIKGLVRSGSPVTNSQSRSVFQVTSLDPRADNAALTSVSSAPNDGFFTQASYRGAFDGTRNWAYGWTAASEYGLLVDPLPAVNQNFGTGTNVSQTFTSGAVSVTITLANVTTAGQITVNPRDINTAPAGRSAADYLDVVFDITADGSLAFNGGATIVFTYNEAFLGGLSEGAITRVTSVSGSNVETVYQPVTVNTTANTVTVTGVNSFSSWYIGQTPASITGWIILN